MKSKTKVTIISGFLGSGKTTLLKNILENREGMKICVIVNDVAAINIDSEIIKEKKLDDSSDKITQISLKNGCVCCSIKEDLLNSVSKVMKEEREMERIIIECSGVSDPQKIIQSLSFSPKSSSAFSSINGDNEENNIQKANNFLSEMEIDGLVTVIDSELFHSQFFTKKIKKDKIKNNNNEKNNENDKQENFILNLLIQQLEFSNVILMNKKDKVTKEERKKVKETIKKINGNAEIHKTYLSNINLKNIFLPQSKFDPEKFKKNTIQSVLNKKKTEISLL
eukprot:TRINITY_DN682_c0_g1_i1.p1 TRINITY_DN682_c0_g1~~TRINITY_DN682_c0_g1_i1.p1  ORF type:complete len:281 (+),score=97.60 TRINITY_DN682_c0_g1_i1:393-1235(+)